MDSFKEIWNAVLTYCEERVTETAFNLWIKKTEFVSFEAATITLRLPSAMYMDVVISQYGTMFSEAFAAIMGEYLAKNYIETKKRPIYIAREVIEYDEKNTKNKEL